MYKSRIVLKNGKQYTVSHDIENINDFIGKLLGDNTNLYVTTWDLAEEDNNNCKAVAIFSTDISSVEYVLK
ncbi:TPA: hypothetical protein LA460_000112 [Clostridium botulinum]|nr:hypothetical protein [Clostridium botulinum]HBJ1652717.1 hypothetical protein [Clostridium botulinum]